MAGGRIKGITIEINGDTVGLDKALKGVNTSIKQTQSSLKDVERLLKLDPKNVELLKQKQEYLTKAVDETKNKLEALKNAERQAQQQFAEGKINQEQYNALQREIAETEQELRRLEEQATQANNSMQSISKLGEGFQEVGGKITAAGQALMPLSLAAAGVGAAAVKITADFDEAMSKVSAISGATGEDFDKLRAKAREMGAETKFSATESAQAFTYMAMAGWDTEKMLNGISGVMSLAAADGLDLATTSDIVTDAMTAFGLKAEQSGHFADVLAKASSSANTNVAMLGESFKYVAPLAGGLGYSVEDTSVALGLMANAGIKGSQAGTSLKTALQNLTKPVGQVRTVMDKYNISIANSDGSMKSLSEVMDMLRTNLGGLSEAQQAAAATTLFGKTAMAGMLTIINASEEDYSKLTEAIANADGTAKKMADTMQQNLNGQLTILKSGLEEAAISIGDALMPLIKGLVAAVQGWVTWFNSLNGATKSTIAIIGVLVAALGPLLVVIGTLITSVGTIMTAIPTMTAAFAAFSAAGGPVMLAVAAVGLLIAAFGSVTDSTEKYKAKASELTDTEKETVDSVNALYESYNQLDDRRNAALQGISTESEYNRTLFAELQSITDENGKVQAGYEERAAFILGELSTALGQEFTMTGDQIDNYKEMTASIENLIQQKQAKALLDADEEKYTEAIKNQTNAFMEYQKAQQAVNDLSTQIKAAKDAETKAQNDLNTAIETSKWVHEGVDPKITQARQSLEEARGTTQGYTEKLEELNETLKNAEDVYVGYNTTIQNHEGLAAAIIAGDQQKISSSLELLKNDFQTAETGTRESLMRQTINLQEQLSNMKAAVDSGAPGITQSQVDNMQSLVNKSQEELNKLPVVVDSANSQLLNQMRISQKIYGGLGKDIGLDYTAGYAGGIKEGQKDVNSAVSTMAEDSLSKTKETLDSHSPSRKTHQIGLDYDLGFAQGITEGTSHVTAAVNTVTTGSLSVLTNNLQQSMAKTLEFQNSLRSSWQSWSASLSTIVSNTFTNIGTNTTTSLGNMRNAFNNSTMAIKADWQTKWQAVQADYVRVLKELEKISKDTLTAIKSAFSTDTTAIRTDTLKSFTEMMAGVETTLKKLKPTVEENFKPAMDYIKSIIPQARTWGVDMMEGYIAGIRSKIKELEATVKSVANTVSDYMHFTRPEKGPLRNYEEWMPHMMKGLSEGIASNKHLITEQIEDLANSMSAINTKQTLRANLFNQVVLDGKVIFDSFNELAGEAL
jgi:phage tail tape measure protein, TP901 family|nr:MAG TPA: minor tail protein [Caudoviricetes sp.]